MKYIKFTNLGAANEFIQKMNIIFLPPAYEGNLLAMDKHGDDKQWSVLIPEELLVTPQYSRDANRALKLLVKKRYMNKQLDLRKHKTNEFHLLQFINPDIILTKTALRKIGWFDSRNKKVEEFRKSIEAMPQEDIKTVDVPDDKVKVNSK